MMEENQDQTKEIQQEACQTSKNKKCIDRVDCLCGDHCGLRYGSTSLRDSENDR